MPTTERHRWKVSLHQSLLRAGGHEILLHTVTGEFGEELDDSINDPSEDDTPATDADD